MANLKHHHKLPPHAQRYLVTGILTIIPIWITWLVFGFVLNQLTRIGMPGVRALSKNIYDDLPVLSGLLLQPWFQNLLAALITLIGLYLLGWMASRVVGRRVIAGFEDLMHRLPGVQTIYGSTRKLVQSLQQEPTQIQRVVLIEFPSPGMKVVGFVTHIMCDADTGEKLAAVYVPTAPNPTSGYLEILPLSQLTATNWSMDEAMTFIISGGVVAPDTIHYNQGVERLEQSDSDNEPAAPSSSGSNSDAA
ncbi:MAG: DUF502 domain-containing protein [Candidatus Competibacteraceae bacterium]|uniref:DUF502 domain-containing protein n=1 Tax=Candidatus Contendobacter odensis Run_B_J11 TaxID=1400861 RepID=A0A7U7GG01_9GAMM|nr:DUF502 domain-containing protein [Candidatus Contendobacter odensis]MBK8534247.1 DUF502 domain-containing protein [Candidatus Competibacteraceae bacterium]CDH47590.1 conserved hypothetical protein [Candidatus Contendobacter odensis Run_B_J11]